jgi:hypothetical protein
MVTTRHRMAFHRYLHRAETSRWGLRAVIRSRAGHPELRQICWAVLNQAEEVFAVSASSCARNSSQYVGLSSAGLKA